MGQKHWKIQLADRFTGEALITAGGRALIVTAGASSRQAITDKDGAAATNPVTPTRGAIEFYTGADVVAVDIYAMTASGHFVVAKTVKPSGDNRMLFDSQQRQQNMVIPFDIADMVAATEFDTGFDLPLNAVVLGEGAGVLVETADATETIDVGLLSSESGGDANGFLATLDVGTAGYVAATAAIFGVLILDTFATTPAVNVAGRHVGDGVAESVSVTLTAGSDTAAGKIVLPYMLPDF